MQKAEEIICLAWSVRDVRLYRALLGDVKATIICARFSSWLYARFSFLDCVAFFRPFFQAGKGGLSKNSNVNNEKCYDLRFYENLNISRVDLHAMESFLDRHFKGLTSKLLLMPGEFRLREQAIIRKYGKNNNVLYWEAGPPGSIYFSPYGTNANARLESVYGQVSVGGMLEIAKTVISSPKVYSTFSWQKLFLIPEYFYLHLLIFFDYYEFREFLPNKHKSEGGSVVQQDLPQKECSEKSLVIFYGQVEEDINHSHFGISVSQLKSFLRNANLNSDKYQVILKPHPRQKENRTNTLLSEEIPSLKLYSSFTDSSKKYFNKVFHITINSNVALELLLQGENVTILGQSMYRGLVGVSNSLVYSETCRETIRAAAESFLHEMFVPIDYRNDRFVKVKNFPKFLGILTRDFHD